MFSLPLDHPAAWALRCTAMWDALTAARQWLMGTSIVNQLLALAVPTALAAIAWWIKRFVDARDGAISRGREMVADARPRLVPMTNSGTQYVLALTVENHGQGVARTRRVGFTGVPEIDTVDEVPFNQARQVATLNVQGSPFFTPAHDGHGEITLVYADLFDNEYRLTIPVTRQPRADGTFNMVVQRNGHQNVGPTLTKKRLREIGGS